MSRTVSLADLQTGERGSARKLRILHVINGLETGGAETVLYRLATRSSSLEHEIVCLERRGPYSDRLAAKGVSVHHLNWTSPATTVRDFVRLHQVIKHSGADVVQAWMYRSNLVAGAAGKLAGIPVVWNIRASTLESLRLATRILARTGGLLAPWLSHSIINCSSRSAELHSRLGYKAATEFVIGNGYDPSEFRPNAAHRQSIRSELGVAPTDFLIGTIARWHAQKGFPILVRALELLRTRGIYTPVVFVGRGMDANNVELSRLMKEHNLPSEILLEGERADIPNVAAALDLHVLASVGGEGFPNAVAETTLSGTPNVATDVGESKLIVDKTGWIVPPDSPEALATAIAEAYEEWSTQPKKWELRRQLARQRIVDEFSLTRMVRAYEEVWRQVASAHVSKLAGSKQAHDCSN